MQSAIILAGGRSSRMGQDKALLKLQGKTLLHRAVSLVKAAGINQILISRNEPGFINDLYPGAGPLAGIQSALLHVNAESCLVLPVDTPLLTADLLTLLLQHPCSCFADSPLPAVIPNTSEVKHWLSNQLQQKMPDRSIQRFLQRFGVVEIKCPDQQALANTNTPDQWQHVKELWGDNAKNLQHHQL